MGIRSALAIAVLVCAASVVRLADAVTFTRTAQTGTTTFSAGGVTGSVGYLGNSGGSGGTVYADYGAQVSGAACSGSDNKTHNNNLEVTCRWQVGDPVSKVIKAKSQLRDKSYHESLTDGNCLVGPPSWDGVAKVTAALNGTAVEQIVNDCIHKATARLLVTVVNP